MAIANHEFDKGPLNVAMQAQNWASFPVLAANYKLEDVRLPNATPLGSIIKPFSVFNVEGLKVGVVGMGNLSSLTSIFDQPNKFGITPINTTEVAQFYIDLLRPMVDLVVFTTHLGLDVDQRMIRETTGIDVVLGSHNHIVLNPPQVLQDCSANAQNPGYV
jgi:5'-nucleotidase